MPARTPVTPSSPQRAPEPVCAFCGASLRLKRATVNGKCRGCGRGVPLRETAAGYRARTAVIGGK